LSPAPTESHALSHAGAHILFLAPAFLADRRRKLVHGVEVFNFLFIRRLLGLGVRVTLPAEPRWRPGFEEHLLRSLPPESAGQLDTVWSIPLRRPLPVSLAATPALARRGPYDLLLLANNGRGVLPAVRALRRCAGVRRSLLFAHQLPRPDYARAVARMGIPVLAVSTPVAQGFSEAGVRDIRVDYGVLSDKLYTPGPRQLSPPPEAPIRFGVVGQLDTPWKGADLALDAWLALPDHLRPRIELHLLAYRNPPAPQRLAPGVVLHPWRTPDRVPEFMRSLDVLIVPSTSQETFSQAMVQGMLTALPVLAFDLPVLAEKLDAGGGLIFRTTAELASLVERLAADPDLRRHLGQAARATALDRYVWRVDHFLARYLPQPRRSDAAG
jgi:glycosyltransferase involved in cell wall biosynthesis